MTWRMVFALALAGLGAALVVSLFQTAPGYMDAYYYYAGGLRLFQGHGFSEMILWNYLDDPAGLPHPSHGYWMPMASLLSALGMKLAGTASFGAGKTAFLAVAAALPPLAAALSFSLNRRKGAAVLSGLLAVFPAFYLSYLPTTDTFGVYMLLGGLFLLASSKRPVVNVRGSTFNFQPILLGLLAGLMHLTRADGVLWLVLAFIALVLPDRVRKDGASSAVAGARSLLTCLAGYLLVMGPWLLRNYLVFGAPLAPGGTRTIWITAYNELFAYPAAGLNAAHWWSSGLGAILRDRLSAFGMNLQTILAVQGEIFLLPLILLGLWRLRCERPVKLGALAWLLMLGVMTVVFPYAGARGGFFHSGAALQPLFFAAVPAGLDVFLSWMARVRGWRVWQSWPVFAAGLIALSLIISILVVRGRVTGADPAHPAWARASMRYTRLEATLQDLGAQPGDTVLVNNAPGYFIASGRPAISIPYGDLSTTLAAAKRYGARYLLLEMDQVEDLYQNPQGSTGMQYLGSVEDTRIFRIEHDSSP